MLELLHEIFPHSSFTNSEWITLDERDFGAEVIVDKGDPIFWIGLRRPSIELIKYIHLKTGWSPFSNSDGHLINVLV